MKTNTTNITFQEDPFPSIEDGLCVAFGELFTKMTIVLFLTVIVLTITLNMLLWVAYIRKRRFRTIAMLYVISLSISDFITAITIGWLEVYLIWDYPTWRFGELGSSVTNAFWCFSLVTPFVHIMLIAIDRYRAVTSSTIYSKHRSWKRELLKIFFMWLYCIGVVLLLAFNFSSTGGTGDSYEWNISHLWYYPFLAIHIILPIIICSTLYCKIVRYVKAKRSRVRQLGSSSLREFKFAKVIAVVIFFLYVVWIPVVAMEAVYAIQLEGCVTKELGAYSVWMTCLSGVLNPLIYLSKSPKVRNVIINEIIFCRSRLIRRFTGYSSTSSSVRRRAYRINYVDKVKERGSSDCETPRKYNVNYLDNVKEKSNGDFETASAYRANYIKNLKEEGNGDSETAGICDVNYVENINEITNCERETRV